MLKFSGGVDILAPTSIKVFISVPVGRSSPNKSCFLKKPKQKCQKPNVKQKSQKSNVNKSVKTQVLTKVFNLSLSNSKMHLKAPKALRTKISFENYSKLTFRFPNI